MRETFFRLNMCGQDGTRSSKRGILSLVIVTMVCLVLSIGPVGAAHILRFVQSPWLPCNFRASVTMPCWSSTVKLKGRVELKTAERNFLMIDPHVTSLKPPTNLVRFVRLVPEFSRCRLIDGCAKATPEQHRHFARAPCR